MIFIADFPPPVHGMANINLAFYQSLTLSTDDVVAINTSPSVDIKYFSTPIWLLAKLLFLPKIIVELFYALTCNSDKVIYRSINGGKGQLIDVFLVILCRLFRSKIFIHHHSFNYITTKRFLFSLLSKVAGKECVHIVLGCEMKNGLCLKYKLPKSSVRVLSNSAFFDDLNQSDVIGHASLKRVIRIGHLSNLCEEKGLEVFLSVCNRLTDAGFDFEAVLAGPFVDEKAKKLFLKNGDNVDYLGPVYGEDKDSFFKSLDVFIFPSKYENEAEPLVLYEAAEFGIFILGTEKGCMKNVISLLGGKTVKESDALVNEIVKIILSSKAGDTFLASSVLTRRNMFRSSINKEKLALTKIVNEFLVRI